MKKIKKILTLVLLFNVSIIGNTQGVQVIANKIATVGYGGDGGPALNAKFSDIQYQRAVDSKGNIYVTDLNNHRVRKIDILTNIVTSVAGNGSNTFSIVSSSASSSGLPYPYGIAFDQNDNLYISSGSSICKVTPTGNISVIAVVGNAGTFSPLLVFFTNNVL
jgi:NHL repeat